MARLIDCFLFSNEIDLLDLRLNELSPHVDEFVLVECRFDFRGRDRSPLYTNSSHPRMMELREKFGHKITSVVVSGYAEVFPAAATKLRADEWEPEFTARNAIMSALRYCDPNDMIIISDVDEIPNIPKWKADTGGGFGPVLLELYQQFYFLNYRAKPSSRFPFCPAPVITPFSQLKSVDSVQRVRREKGSLLRIHKAGWHFSYQGGVDRIIKKIETFSHFEYDKEQWKDPERIKRCIELGLDPFERQGLQEFELVPIDESFPVYLQENVDRFRHMLYRPCNSKA